MKFNIKQFSFGFCYTLNTRTVLEIFPLQMGQTLPCLTRFPVHASHVDTWPHGSNAHTFFPSTHMMQSSSSSELIEL